MSFILFLAGLAILILLIYKSCDLIDRLDKGWERDIQRLCLQDLETVPGFLEYANTQLRANGLSASDVIERIGIHQPGRMISLRYWFSRNQPSKPNDHTIRWFS